MLTKRNAVLACLMVALTAPACGGRSGLDDFANGADNLLPGSQGGQKVDGDGGGGAADADGGNSNGDAAAADAGPLVLGPADKGEIGAQCRGDKACTGDTSECLTEAPVAGAFTVNFPGGYCTIKDCVSDANCPSGTGCMAGFGMQNCMQLCDDADDCRSEEGYQCGTVAGSTDETTYCVPTFGGGGNQGNTGGNDVSMLCQFVCGNDPIQIAQCMEANDLSVCTGGQMGGGFGG